jgi:hypothetical protein
VRWKILELILCLLKYDFNKYTSFWLVLNRIESMIYKTWNSFLAKFMICACDAWSTAGLCNNILMLIFCFWDVRNPRTIGPEAMAVDAMKKMEAPPSPVQFLPVIDDDNVVIGIVTLHGLVSAGL